MPEVPVAGVPDRVAVPSPLSTKLTPLGSGPVSDSAAVGEADDVTVKVPLVPSVKVVLSPEVMAGAAFTVRVKLWVAFAPTPLAAVMVSG